VIFGAGEFAARLLAAHALPARDTEVDGQLDHGIPRLVSGHRDFLYLGRLPLSTPA
jgi:hypothetical protein